MTFIDSQATISANLLRTMQRSGIRWVLLGRKGSNLTDAQAYAYANTIVFPVFGDTDGLFLLAMTEGTYADDQLDRYRSGLWGGWIITDLDVVIDKALEIHNSWS